MKTVYFSLIILLFSSQSILAQKSKPLNPKGIYSEIKVAKQNKMIQELIDTKTRASSIETIFNNINQYNPPVLYVFSQALFVNGELQTGIDWYLFAQLNALYDANRCSDKTARQATTILESKFRPAYEDYIKSNKQAYLESIDKVVMLFNKIPQDYDIRWINLHGMDAVTTSLSDEKENKNDLSLPKESWPEIKEKTIGQFIEANRNSVK